MQNQSHKAKKIITLVGLMGVGKTTIGAKLAKKLGYYFVDSDYEIEDREGKTISEIFAKQGEKYFRQVEKSVIQELVMRDEEMVLSLGGGAFMDDDLRKILKEKTLTIWLDATIEDILHRTHGKNNRPLLNQKDRRLVLEELAQKRYPIYAEADVKFNASTDSRDEIIRKIIKRIS